MHGRAKLSATALTKRQPNMEMDTKTYEDLARAMLGMHNIAKDSILLLFHLKAAFE